MQATLRPSRTPKTSLPLWPWAVEATMWGMEL